MHMAFYKGEGDLLSKMIRVRTGSPYSHVEIVISGGIGRDSDCFSASWQDGGVRRKTIRLGPNSWDLVAVTIDEQRLNRVMRTQIGKPYDRTGALLWKTPWTSMQDRKKWFCSEICAHIFGLPEPWTYSPGSLFRALTKEPDT